ncbi:hypothetical protein N9L68_05960 [bacterium]|nr:hypothetical protein [bacterium]
MQWRPWSTPLVAALVAAAVTRQSEMAEASGVTTNGSAVQIIGQCIVSTTGGKYNKYGKCRNTYQASLSPSSSPSEDSVDKRIRRDDKVLRRHDQGYIEWKNSLNQSDRDEQNKSSAVALAEATRSSPGTNNAMRPAETQAHALLPSLPDLQIVAHVREQEHHMAVLQAKAALADVLGRQSDFFYVKGSSDTSVHMVNTFRVPDAQIANTLPGIVVESCAVVEATPVAVFRRRHQRTVAT